MPWQLHVRKEPRRPFFLIPPTSLFYYMMARRFHFSRRLGSKLLSFNPSVLARTLVFGSGFSQKRSLYVHDSGALNLIHKEGGFRQHWREHIQGPRRCLWRNYFFATYWEESRTGLSFLSSLSIQVFVNLLFVWPLTVAFSLPIGGSYRTLQKRSLGGMGSRSLSPRGSSQAENSSWLSFQHS